MKIRRALGLAVGLLLAASGYASAAPYVYASNFDNDTITAYDATSGASLGTVVTGGAGADGFNDIVVLPDGSFFVTAQLTNNVIKYSPLGVLDFIFDPANVAGLNSPQGAVIGPDGALYVASSANDKVLRYNATTGAFLGTFADLSGLGHVGPIDLAFGGDGNLYVTAFDNGSVIKLNGATGAVIGTTPGPAGLGFAASALGADGNLYVTAVDLNTFAGSVFRYTLATSSLSPFIPAASGGLQSPGGIDFDAAGHLLLANLVFDATFHDAGSTILRFDATTGAPLGTLVAAGNGLNIPFFLAVSSVAPAASPAQPVPEPASALLLVTGGALLARQRRRSRW